jgi:hypothetical protein
VDDGGRGGVFTAPFHVTSVDLERAEFQFAQRMQTCVAGAEVIEGDTERADPGSPDRVDRPLYPR